MRTGENSTHRFYSLSDLHRVLGLPKPLHPMISLINNQDNQVALHQLPDPHILNFYKLSYKMNLQGQFRYGQHFYDFEEGGLFFVCPNQVVASHDYSGDHTGYTLLIHPDFLLTYPLAKTIKQYGFFSYAIHEALYLSEPEKVTVVSLFQSIEAELGSRIDVFSQDVLIAQIELLLTYSNRFYQRQFITRKAVNHDLLQQLEDYLDAYINGELLASQGIPTVHHLADQLNLSPSYLSDLLRSLTGQNAQQHIHHRLLEKAKERLTTTRLSISEVAYTLGFEHAPSFSRFFKRKTNQSPQAFRQSFS